MLVQGTVDSATGKARNAAGDAYAAAKDAANSGGQFVNHASAAAQGKQPGVWDKVKNTVTGHSNDGVNAGDAAGAYVNAAGEYVQVSSLHLSVQWHANFLNLLVCWCLYRVLLLQWLLHMTGCSAALCLTVCLLHGWQCCL